MNCQVACFICSHSYFSDLMLTYKVTGRKPYNDFESSLGKKTRKGFGALELQVVCLSFWGGPVGSSLKARDMVELDHGVLECKPRNWWICDQVVVTALPSLWLPQTFCVIPGKLLKVSVTRVESFEIHTLKRPFGGKKKKKKKRPLCRSRPACLYLHSNLSNNWFVHS